MGQGRTDALHRLRGEKTALATTIRKLRAAEEKARRQYAARGTRKKEDTRSARDVMNQIKPSRGRPRR